MSIPIPQAGINCDALLDEQGLHFVPNTLRRFDIVPFSPKTRTTNPRYGDFSLANYWVLESWHHGRGAPEWEDPFAFYDSSAVDSRIRGQLTLDPLQLLTTKADAASVGGNPVCFRLFTTAASLFLATGGASRDVFAWDNTNGDWDPETSGIAADPTDMLEYQGIIYVATGEANNMRKRTAGVWADGVVPADFLAQFGNMVLYRADNINEIYWTVAAVPGATDWNGPIYVGDTNTQIRSLAVGDGKLYVGKDDGLYYIQDQRAYQLLDMSFARDPNNFKNMKWWQGALYFPILNGLFRLIGSTLQAVGPNLGAAGAVELGIGSNINQGTLKSLASGKRGRIVDLTPTDNFLYAVIDAGTTGFSGTSQIVAYNGTGWHQIIEGAASGTRIRAAFFTGSLATTGQLTNPRLWFGYGNDPYNIILPLGTEDPFEYSAETYAASGTLDSPSFDAGLANIFKEWVSIQVYSEGLTADETLQISYTLDDMGIGETNGQIRQNLIDSDGTAYAFTVSPYQKIRLPANTIAKKLQLRLSLARGGTTTLTPKIKKVVVEYMTRPDTRYGWQCILRAGKDIKNSYDNMVVKRDAAEWMQLLMRYRDYRQRVNFDPGNMEPGITNLVLNPSFTLDADGNGLATNWNEVSNPTTTLSVIRKIHGLRSQQVVTASSGTEGVETDSITTVVGTRYTASAYIYLVSGDRVTLEFRNQTGGLVISSTQLTALTTQFIRIETTGYATTTTSRVRVVRNTGDASAATTYNVNAVQLEITPDRRDATFLEKASQYCDGDQPRSRWSGRPYLSTSIRDATYKVYVTNIGASETARPGIMEMVRGHGAEQRLIVSLAEVE